MRTFANKHHLDVLAAYEAESFQTDKAAGEKSKMPSDQLFEPDNAAVINSFVSSTQDYRLLSYLTRLITITTTGIISPEVSVGMVVPDWRRSIAGVISGRSQACGIWEPRIS